MNSNLEHYFIALTMVEGVGPVTARTLLEEGPELPTLFHESYQYLIERGLNKRIAGNICSAREKVLLRADEELEFIQKNGITIRTILSDSYPERLRQCADAPIVIYTLGNGPVESNRIVSVVGTRKATTYGKRICSELIEELSSYNVIIVSGLAYGIDIAAHNACLENDLPTVGVLAHGLDMLYPAAHRKTGKALLESGLLLTEYMSRTIPDKDNFPRRNRIVAGMTDATIVVESGPKGGSLITAHLALDYNREVFAFPGRVGDPQSEGTNRLIKSNKAALIESASDLAYLLGWDTSFRKEVVAPEPILTTDEKKVYDYLHRTGTVNIDDLAAKCKIKINELSVLLLTMEINGIVRSLPGKTFDLA